MSLLFSSATLDDDHERLTDSAGGSEYKRLCSSRQLRYLPRRRRFVPPGTLALRPRKRQSDEKLLPDGTAIDHLLLFTI